jgi:hypothetical protein
MTAKVHKMDFKKALRKLFFNPLCPPNPGGFLGWGTPPEPPPKGIPDFLFSNILVVRRYSKKLLI